MELISLAREGFQKVAEHAASYRLGQAALRFLDRSLWVVEKCARWAVPPPLDQDERPQPELVRPLPWVFFLVMLVTLRVTRESISLVNLVMGKPPLRSADVVMYIQSKRRYLRTLKYQGNRVLRARTSGQQTQSWSQSLRSLFEFTMCFRRQSPRYGNNNTTSVSNNDEVLVVKRSKRGREQSSPVASTSETTMERLIEKMLVDLDADSEDDSSFTLTNVTSVKSDRSDITVDSDQDIAGHNNAPDNNDINSHTQNTPHNEKIQTSNKSDIQHIENKTKTPITQHTKNPSTTPEKRTQNALNKTPENHQPGNALNKTPENHQPGNALSTPEMHQSGNAISTPEKQYSENTLNASGILHNADSQSTLSYGTWNTRKISNTSDIQYACNTLISHEISQIEIQNASESTYADLHEVPRSSSTPEKSRLSIFLDQESAPPEDISKEVKRPQDTSPSKIPRTPVVEPKIANGRTVKRVPSKKKGSKSLEKEKRSSEVHVETSGNSTW